MNDKYLTVSVINRYIKHRLDTDENLQTVFIKGEISNFKAHSTGHLYFSIKDETSKINAIMFSKNANNDIIICSEKKVIQMEQNRSELRKKIMTILYQINVYEKNKMK